MYARRRTSAAGLHGAAPASAGFAQQPPAQTRPPSRVPSAHAQHPHADEQSSPQRGGGPHPILAQLIDPPAPVVLAPPEPPAPACVDPLEVTLLDDADGP